MDFRTMQARIGELENQVHSLQEQLSEVVGGLRKSRDEMDKGILLQRDQAIAQRDRLAKQVLDLQGIVNAYASDPTPQGEKCQRCGEHGHHAMNCFFSSL